LYSGALGRKTTPPSSGCNPKTSLAIFSPEDRQEGFLSAEFTSRQVTEMAEDLGTTIACVDGEVVAFLCAFRNDFDHGSPVITKMLESYKRAELKVNRLTPTRVISMVPCASIAHIAAGLLRGLYGAQKHELAGRFEIGVAFVSRSNPHSLKAHVAGLEMTEVCDFESRGNVYVILAF
jgi:hypothetical protein